jgi:hypothetical protein
METVGYRKQAAPPRFENVATTPCRCCVTYVTFCAGRPCHHDCILPDRPEKQEQEMQNTVDTAWERAGWGANMLAQERPILELCRWSFAYLPDARMKAVAAEWIARVLLGADPDVTSEEELQMLTVSTIMAAKDTNSAAIRCDA